MLARATLIIAIVVGFAENDSLIELFDKSSSSFLSEVEFSVSSFSFLLSVLFSVLLSVLFSLVLSEVLEAALLSLIFSELLVDDAIVTSLVAYSTVDSEYTSLVYSPSFPVFFIQSTTAIDFVSLPALSLTINLNAPFSVKV